MPYAGWILEFKILKNGFDLPDRMILSKMAPLFSLVVKNGTKKLLSFVWFKI